MSSAHFGDKSSRKAKKEEQLPTQEAAPVVQPESAELTAIRRQVLARLGQVADLDHVDVHPLRRGRYRVNVVTSRFEGDSEFIKAQHIPHSFYLETIDQLQTDGTSEPRIVRSTPAIRRIGERV